MRRALAVAVLVLAAGAVARDRPRLWLVTERGPDGAIRRSWVTAHVHRDACAVTLEDEGVVLVGGPEGAVTIEPWR